MAKYVAALLAILLDCVGLQPVPRPELPVACEARGTWREPAVEALPAAELLEGVETDEAGYPLATLDSRGLRQLLLEDDFEALDANIDALRDEYLRDPRRERWLLVALGVFASSSPEIGAAIDRWQHALPSSWNARLARGTHLVQVGWDRRGGDFASKTSAQQFAEMSRAIDRARRALQAVVDAHPEALGAWIGLVEIARADGDDPGDAALYEQARASHPLSVTLHDERFYSLYPRWGGSHARIVAHLEELAPHFESHPRLRSLCARIDDDVAWMGRRSAGWSRTARRLGQALERGEYVGLYYRAVLAHREAGELDAALALGQRGLAIYPRAPGLLLQHAKTLYALGRHEDSVATWSSIYDVDPDDAEAREWGQWAGRDRLTVAWELHQAGRDTDAFAIYAEAERFWADDFYLHYLRGRSYVRLGDLASARLELERSVELDPHFVASYEDLVYVLYELGDMDALDTLTARLVELEPNNPRALDLRRQAHCYLARC